MRSGGGSADESGIESPQSTAFKTGSEPMTPGKLLSIFCTMLFAVAFARDAALAETNSISFPTTAPSAPQPDPQFHVDPKTTIQYLASDELEGRLIGTPGLQRAADMIANDFSKLGLQTVPA